MFNHFKTLLAKLGLLDKIRTTYFYHDLAAIFNKDLKSVFIKEKDFYSRFIQKNDLCYDIGANIGGKTYVFHKIGSKIIAIEPDPRAFEFLKKRFGRKKNITLLNIGLGEKEEVKILMEFTSSSLSTFDNEDAVAHLTDPRFKGQQVAREVELQIQTLDQVIAEYGLPRYCKISVVGYEYYVIKGLTRSIPFVSFSMNSPYHNDKTVLCIKMLGDINNYEFNYIAHPTSGFILNNWITGTDMINIIAEMKMSAETRYFEIYARIINMNHA